jgi:hypothetical protein
MLALMLTVLTGLAAGDPAPGGGPKDKAPLKKELFANEDWYRSQKGAEQSFVGVLQRVERGKGGVGFGRFNPYRLLMDARGKKDTREVYVGGKPDLLTPFIGKRVKLTGKAVDMEVEGRMHREIWPARIEELKAGPPREKPVPFSRAQKPDPSESPARPAPGGDERPAGGKPLKVFARGSWSFGTVGADAPKKGEQAIFRKPSELASRPPWNRSDAPEPVIAKMATAAVAKALKVDSIDWERQMLVLVTAGVRRTGGWRVNIESVEVAGKTITVHYSVTPPKGFATQALTHPGQVALVERAEGTPKFVLVPGKGGPKIRPRPPVKPDERRALPVGAKAEGAKKARELKVFARAPGGPGGVALGGHRVIRGEVELTKVVEGVGGNIDKVLAKVTKMLKVEKIDWDRQMLVVLSGGMQPTTGYRVELTSLKVEGDELTVRWKLLGPRPGQPLAKVVTHPNLTLLVERFDDTVRFDPSAARSGVKEPVDR